MEASISSPTTCTLSSSYSEFVTSGECAGESQYILFVTALINNVVASENYTYCGVNDDPINPSNEIKPCFYDFSYGRVVFRFKKPLERAEVLWMVISLPLATLSGILWIIWGCVYCRKPVRGDLEQGQTALDDAHSINDSIVPMHDLRDGDSFVEAGLPKVASNLWLHEYSSSGTLSIKRLHEDLALENVV